AADAAEEIAVAETVAEGADVDPLGGLGIKELRELAVSEGVAKSGSKQEIADRIRAKRATVDDSDPGREGLVEKAKSLGIEDADDLTDAELQAVLEQEE